MLPLQALTKAEAFAQNDPSGIMMAITAMAVVFAALALLWLLFTLVGKAMSAATRLADEAEARHKTLAAKNKQPPNFVDSLQVFPGLQSQLPS